MPRQVRIEFEVATYHVMVAVEPGEVFFQSEVALGGEELLHEFKGGNEEHGDAVAQDEFSAQGAKAVGFPAARQSESEDILVTLDEVAF